MSINRPIIVRERKKIPKGIPMIDTVPVSLEELFVVRNPIFAKKTFKDSPAWKAFLRETKADFIWMYWPKEYAVRMLNEDAYFELRTARNRNLITAQEQKKYRNASIGIVGLSVGSSILAALVLGGGPKKIKIGDFDTLAPTNLNRIRGGLRDVGVKKIEMAARNVWSVDPFAELELWPNGLTQESIEKFMLRGNRLDIFIDEMDDLALKVKARLIAKKNKMPVLMATDNGDGILLDVERFDEEPKRPIFHGLVGNLTVQQAAKAKGKEWIALVSKIIGGPHMPERHRSSLAEIGTSLAGVPQLGTDALLAGSMISLAVRKILNNEPLPSGRYIIDMNDVLLKPFSLR